MWILLGGGKPQWKTFRHNGPYFPDEYTPHNIPIFLDNQKISLDVETEEKITNYAKYVGTDYVNNPRFNKNFYQEIKNKLNITFEQFMRIDFSEIKQFLEKEKEKRLNLSKEEKQNIKERENT